MLKLKDRHSVLIFSNITALKQYIKKQAKNGNSNNIMTKIIHKSFTLFHENFFTRRLKAPLVFDGRLFQNMSPWKTKSFLLHYSHDGTLAPVLWLCWVWIIDIWEHMYRGARPLITLCMWWSFRSPLSWTGSSPNLRNSTLPTWVRGVGGVHKNLTMLFCMTCSLFLNLADKPLYHAEHANWLCS